MPRGVYVRTTPPWNKGLTKETDERVARMARTKSMAPFKPLTESHKLNIGKGIRKWHSDPANKQRHRKAILAAIRSIPNYRQVMSEANKRAWVTRRARLVEDVKAKLREEYGLADDDFVPARYSEHRFARALVMGSGVPPPVTQLRQGQRRFYYPYKGGVVPVDPEGDEYGVVDGELVPIVTINGLPKMKPKAPGGATRR